MRIQMKLVSTEKMTEKVNKAKFRAVFALSRGTIDQPLGLNKTLEVSIRNNRVKNRNHDRAIHYKDFR
jgi:hypothetical protein